MNKPTLSYLKVPRIALMSAAILFGTNPLVRADIESIDGSGNNTAHPAWGGAGTDLLRLAPTGYADGIAAPSLPGNLSARAISNLLNNQALSNKTTEDIATVDQSSVSDFGYVFGQFMDHDLDLTFDGGASFPIAVAAGDPVGPGALPFTRSQTDPATGTNNPAQQVNAVTSYFDLSQVYGSSQTVATALRTLKGGLLKTSPGNMLPYDNSTYFTSDQITELNMANDAGAVATGQLFATGDRRGNENIELTALETLFVRNHNLIASGLQTSHPAWPDEQLYQEARKLNIAQYQSVIYSEWIPAILGPQAVPAYAGYNPGVNASIANEFSTVAYRFGHSMLSPDIAREANDGQPLAENIELAFDFFDPNLLNPKGVVDPLTGLTSTDIGPILKADADGNGQAMDLMAINAIRNLLFGNAGDGGDDLMARDVQRGRDNGIPDYNTVRKAFGLPVLANFAQIVGPGANPVSDQQTANRTAVQKELALAYPGGINTVDAFEGGLAENHVPGSEVGPTFQAILADQFRRLRDGDRFFYLNEKLNPEEMDIVQKGNSLAKIITANTNVTNLQAGVIQFRASIGGTVAGAAGGAPGVIVQLEDQAGDILAMTKTNPQGQYLFNEQSGPSAASSIAPGVCETGMYLIVPVAPQGMRITSTSSGPVLISRGDTHITGIDFSVAPAQPAPAKPKPPVIAART